MRGHLASVSAGKRLVEFAGKIQQIGFASGSIHRNPERAGPCNRSPRAWRCHARVASRFARLVVSHRFTISRAGACKKACSLLREGRARWPRWRRRRLRFRSSSAKRSSARSGAPGRLPRASTHECGRRCGRLNARSGGRGAIPGYTRRFSFLYRVFSSPASLVVLRCCSASPPPVRRLGAGRCVGGSSATGMGQGGSPAARLAAGLRARP